MSSPSPGSARDSVAIGRRGDRYRRAGGTSGSRRVEFTGDTGAVLALVDVLHDEGLTVKRDGAEDPVTTSVLVGGGWAAWDRIMRALRRWPFTGSYRVLDGTTWSAPVDPNPRGSAAH